MATKVKDWSVGGLGLHGPELSRMLLRHPRTEIGAADRGAQCRQGDA